MGWETALDDLMSETVTIAPATTVNRYGAAAYGAPVSVAAHVAMANEVFTSPDGRLLQETGRAYLSGVHAVGENDLLTLPDGSTPTIMLVAQRYDESGPFATVIHFGLAQGKLA